MKKVNVSVKQMGKFAGKWIAVDTVKDKIIAVSDTLRGISPLVIKKTSEKIPEEKIPATFKVPYKDEGPYIL